MALQAVFGTPAKTYATYDNAMKKLQKLEALDERVRYIIAATSDGRFFPVVIGAESFDLVHAGFHVAG